MKNLLLIIVMIHSLTIYSQSENEKFIYGKPEVGERYFNPILTDFVADPSVVMFDSVFYLYGTTDINQGLTKMGPPVVWKSKDFVNWSFDGTILNMIDWDKPHKYIDNKGKERNGYFRYWAPGKAVEMDGKYYLFPTIVTPDDKMGTYVVVADHPEGPFQFINGESVFYDEPDKESVEAKPIVEDIDGEPFVDDDGKSYIFWRRRNASQMKTDFTGLIGDPIQVRTSFGGYSEGPVMFRRKDKYYYVYTLSGRENYCNAYMISDESPLGPFKKPDGNGIFIHSDLNTQVWGPGHGNVFQVPGTDDYYFLYLEYGEGGTTRQIFANKMSFNNDGTIQNQEVNFDGVGYLNGSDTRMNLALNADIKASSELPEKKIERYIAPDPNKLKNMRVNESNGQLAERYFQYGAPNIADNSNGSCWRAAPDDKNPWVVVDLKNKQTVSSVEIAFTLPTYGHSWVLEKSNNGKKWTMCAREDQKKVKSPHVVNGIGKARFLRLSVLEGEAGVWELKVY